MQLIFYTLLSATKSNLSQVFQKIGNIISQGDNLFLFFTDHGNRINAQSHLCLWGNELLSPAELSSYLNYIPDNVRTNIVMEQCYSGGFINELSGANRTIATSCSSNQLSYSEAGEYNDFVYHWTNAIAGVTPDNVQVDADINKDGYISMEEAFLYAKANDPAAISGKEEPMYDSRPDTFGYRYNITGAYSLLPKISGGKHLSTGKGATFSVTELPENAIVNWYLGSGSDLAGTGSPASLSASGFNKPFSQSMLKMVVTTSDGGIYPEDSKGITVWRPGTHMNKSLIHIDDHVLTLSFNPIGATDLNWGTNASNITLGSQGYHIIDFHADEKEDPDFTEVWVSFRNPLGEYTSIIETGLR